MELSVEGVVSGTVVIVADKRIRITGNLTYEQHPEEFAESQDYLALLSENYIEIAPPSITGRGDLTVHGALYAKRRFVVRNFRNRNRGLLHLYGSLTAGSLSATEPRYATRIDFDPRFEQLRPPNFPMTNKYELDSWDEVWTVDDRWIYCNEHRFAEIEKLDVSQMNLFINILYLLTAALLTR